MTRNTWANAERAAERLQRLERVNGEEHDALPVRRLDYFTGAQVDVAEQVFDDELVEGVVGTEAMMVFYGDSNSGKTFLAIDMAAAIERGAEWMGRRTVSGLVVYLATEAPKSVQLRIAAYRKRHGATLANLVVVSSPINLYDGVTDVEAVVALVRRIESDHGEKVALVLGDTLARIAAGANENSGEDMAVVLSNAEAIRSALACAFGWIHHSGKDAARGMRGWSGMRAHIDTEVEITVDEATGLRCAEVTKQRDLDGKGDRFGFKLERVRVGTNRWGADRTSAVVVSTDAPDKLSKTKRHSEVAGAIVEFLTARGAGCKRGAMAAHFDGRYHRSNVYREAARLIEAGVLIESAGILALPGKPGATT